MSFGFSVGDIIAATKLASDIWMTCFSSVSGAKMAYIRYGEHIKGLGSSLQALWEILVDHENKLERQQSMRGAAAATPAAARLAVGAIDLGALADIIGDFADTLRRTQALLNKYSVFKRDGRGFVSKIKWSISTEAEVHKLTQDCAFHIAKIQFVTEPLKLKFVLDLSGQINDMQDAIVGRLDQLEALMRSSQGLPPLPSFVATAAEPAPPYELSCSLTSPKLEERFQETFDHHPRFRSIMPEIQIQDYTEAAAWWIDNGTSQFSKQKICGAQLVPADLYLNLLKAAWLLKRCEESMAYRRLAKNSLWCTYICGLLESISTEVRGFTERQLLVPDENSLLRLPDDCFYVWLNKPERDVVLGIRDERPGEEKILQLNLETHLDPERFTRELLVFRKDRDDTTLRLCDTTENFEIGSRSSEEFTVNSSEIQFVASYVAEGGPRGPAWNVSMRRGLEKREYLFKTPRDLLDFQRAIVGSQVMFDQPSVRAISCAPLFGSGQQGSNVRIQMWLDKPLPRLLVPFLSPDPSTPPPKNVGLTSPPPSPPVPHMVRSMTGLSHSSSGSSSMGGASHDVMEFRLPAAPRLVLFYRARERWMFLLVPMEETLVIKPKRCCGNNLKRLFSGDGDSCCHRTVLESDKGNIEGLLFAPSRDDPAAIDVLRAAPGRAKKNGEKVGFKYVSIDFRDDKEKQRFNKAFEDVKTLRRAQKLRTGKQMQEAKQQAYVTGSLGAPGGGIVRSTTWSSMAPSDRGGWVK